MNARDLDNYLTTNPREDDDTMTEQALYYYNFRTGEHEALYEPPADWSPYISQSEPAQTLYRLYQETGDSPIMAAKKVLELCVPKEVTP